MIKYNHFKIKKYINFFFRVKRGKKKDMHSDLYFSRYKTRACNITSIARVTEKQR